MVIVDATEVRAGTTLPDLTKYPELSVVVSSDLEARTGADLMIVPIDTVKELMRRVPPVTIAKMLGIKVPEVARLTDNDLRTLTPEMLRLHLSCNAMLVQVKRGLDVASSVGERLADALIRMRATGAPRHEQRVLLWTGTLVCRGKDEALIDGQAVADTVPGVTYWGIQASIDAFWQRGGCVVNLSRTGLIPQWLKMTERRLKEYVDEPVKPFFTPLNTLINPPHPADPLQIPVRAPDGAQLLASLNGIGHKLAMSVYKYCGSAATALQFLTDLASATDGDRPTGIGRRKIQAVREQLGLGPNDRCLVVMTNQEWAERENEKRPTFGETARS